MKIHTKMKTNKNSKIHLSLKEKTQDFYKALSNPNYRGNKCKKMHWWK